MSFELLDSVENSLAAQRVGIIEFAESDEYCDRPLYPRQRVLLKLIFLEDMVGWEEDIISRWINGGTNGQVTISPNIRERRDWLRENDYQHFGEVVFVGGRRSSKGYVTGIAMAYQMWNTLQLQDPGRHYGIDPTKNIAFPCIAGSEAQAKEHQFNDFSNAVLNCAAFKRYIVRPLETELRVATPADIINKSNQTRHGIKNTRDEARLRGFAWAANAGTLRGAAAMCITIDEMAHMLTGETKSSADEIYKAAEPSTGQFHEDAMIFCNSSPYSKVGAFYERYTEAMKPFYPDMEPGEPLDENSELTNGNPVNMTFQFPSWELYENAKDYVSPYGHRFSKQVEVSPEYDVKSPELTASERAAIRKARSMEAGNPETYKVERRGQFAEVTDAYLNPNSVDNIFKGRVVGYTDERKPIYQPFFEDISTAINLYDYKFHLDPSSTTAGFGFAIAHVERIEDPFTTNGDGTHPLIDHVVFDLVKRWNPKDFPGETIRWDTVINEVLHYADIYRPFEITMDQYQSEEPIQTLGYKCMERGINVRIHKPSDTNVDQWHRWETFKTAINHGLVHAGRTPLEIQPYGPDEELKFLQRKNTQGKNPRVEKQDIGPVQTKDMADCMAQCTESLIGNVLAQQIRQRAINAAMAVGAQGGYGIGIDDSQRPSLRNMIGHGQHTALDGHYPSRGYGEQHFPGSAQPGPTGLPSASHGGGPGRGRGSRNSARRGMNRARGGGRW